MTWEKFWSIIDRIRAKADMQDEASVKQFLYTELINLPQDELLGFDCAWQSYRNKANFPKMVAAACIINDGSSDDRFTDFRNWLIMQGYDAYRQALIDPDNLAALNIPFRDTEWMGCGNVAWYAYAGQQLHTYFEKEEIGVMNTPGQNSNAVAELALGMMVYAVRNFYNGTSGTELMGKKLGIHAYGNVGRNVARVAKGFGMEVYAYDAFCPKEVIEKDGVKALDSAEELYKTCQVVSLHIPATAETKNSINYALLKDMPKGAMLVNTARKEVINEAELIKLMEERADFKYITDIMPAANAEFAEKFAGRYFSTPKKMGAQTAEANINAGIAAAQQIVGFLKDGCEKFRVNK